MNPKFWRGKAVISLQKIMQSTQPRYVIEDAYIRLLIQSYRGMQSEKEREDQTSFTLPGVILSSSYEHGFTLVIVVEVYQSIAHYDLISYRRRMGKFPSPGSEGSEEMVWPEDDPNHFDVELKGYERP